MDDQTVALNSEILEAPAADGPLQLPAELTIYTVGELHPQWNSWVKTVLAGKAGDVVLVHGDAVTEVDAAGLQLLISLQRSLSVAGRNLSIVQPSHALRTACAALGLLDWLNTHSPKDSS